MNYENYLSDIPLTDLADVIRVRKDDVLPKGTLYIRVSACKKSDEEIWYVMEEEGNPGEGYAYLEAKTDWNPVYMAEVLNANSEKFMTRYVGKNINISMDLFKFYKLDYHPERETQDGIAEMLDGIRAAIADRKNKIERCKKMKEWSLNRLFA